ncbi:ATP-binding cassette sub-family G member 1-like isoform X2, partial [Dinothrombium tinctorium]
KYWFDFVFFHTKFGKKFRNCVDLVHDFSLKVIEKRKNEILEERAKNGNQTRTQAEDTIFLGSKRKKVAFIDLLINNHIDGLKADGSSDFSLADVCEEVDTFMFEGFETTAVAISWTLHLLGNDERAQNKAYEEIEYADNEMDEFQSITEPFINTADAKNQNEANHFQSSSSSLTKVSVHDEDEEAHQQYNICIALVWINLTYVINENRFFKNLIKFKFRDMMKASEKVILHSQIGSVRNGCLMAIMGKSGSGKSTLIESLTGRRTKGITGDIWIAVKARCGCNVDTSQMKISFIPQNDHLLSTLTVYESILFASKLKNPNFKRRGHKNICNELLLQLNLMSCRNFHNPADYAIEVASGDYGEEVLQKMESYQANEVHKNFDVSGTKLKISSVIASMTKHSFKLFISETFILTQRTLLATVRDPILNFFRLFMHLFVAVSLILLYRSDVGKESGCIVGERSSNFTVYFSFEEFRDIQIKVFQNLGFFFFTMIFITLGSMMPTVMMFPLEMSVFLRERTNGWYTSLSFYIAKTIADIPFQALYTTIYTLITYYITGQINSSWRFFTFLLITLLCSFIGQSIGLLVGAMCAKNMNSAIFIAPMSALPFVLFAGFLVKFSMLPNYTKLLTYISFMRYAFEAMIIIIYGFDRCKIVENESIAANETSFGNDSVNKVVIRLANYLSRLELSYSNARPVLQALAVDKNLSIDELKYFDHHLMNFNLNTFQVPILYEEDQSSVIKEFDANESNLMFDIQMLIVILLLYRTFTYFVFVFKTK